MDALRPVLLAPCDNDDDESHSFDEVPCGCDTGATLADCDCVIAARLRTLYDDLLDGELIENQLFIGPTFASPRSDPMRRDIMRGDVMRALAGVVVTLRSIDSAYTRTLSTLAVGGTLDGAADILADTLDRAHAYLRVRQIALGWSIARILHHDADIPAVGLSQCTSTASIIAYLGCGYIDAFLAHTHGNDPIASIEVDCSTELQSAEPTAWQLNGRMMQRVEQLRMLADRYAAIDGTWQSIVVDRTLRPRPRAGQ
jgi:hypothetical protein